MVKVLKRFTLNLMFAPTCVREEPNNCSDINFNFTVILVVVSSHFFKIYLYLVSLYTPFIVILFISTADYIFEIYGPVISAKKLFSRIRIEITGGEQVTTWHQFYSPSITEEKQGYDMY